MKTISKIMTLALLTFVCNAYSQVSLSFKAGIHNGKTNFDGISNTILPQIHSISDLSYGLGIDVALDPSLSISSGINYKKKGFETGIGTDIKVGDFNMPIGVKVRNEINYLEVPLLLKYKIATRNGVRPFINAGPSIGRASNGYVKTQGTAIIDFTINKTDLPLDNETYNRWEWMMNIGGGIELPYKKGFVIAELGYEKAMNDFMTDHAIVDLGARHSGLNYRIGYGIKF